MESLEIARLLREAFPQEVLDIQEFRGQAAVLLRHGRILDVLVYAREHFDMFVMATVGVVCFLGGWRGPVEAGFFPPFWLVLKVYGVMAFNAGTFTGYLAWGVGVLVAFMTAFYSFRLYFSVFTGQFRGTEHQREHLHESPRVVTVPLLVLAVGAVASGWLGIPHGVQGGCRALPRVGA